jgi:hypothetical protein
MSDYSEEHTAFIFRVNEWAKQETSKKQEATEFFEPEDEGNAFPRNVAEFLLNY